MFTVISAMMTTLLLNSSLLRKTVATNFAGQPIRISLNTKLNSQDRAILSSALNKDAGKLSQKTWYRILSMLKHFKSSSNSEKIMKSLCQMIRSSAHIAHANKLYRRRKTQRRLNAQHAKERCVLIVRLNGTLGSRVRRHRKNFMRDGPM
jgi:hypothetical protein